MCVLLTSKEKSTPPIRSQFTLKCKVRLHDTVIPTTTLRSASGCQGPGLVYKNRARRNLENLTGSITGFYLLIMTQCLDPRYEPACWTAYVPKSRALTLTLSSDGGYLKNVLRIARVAHVSRDLIRISADWSYGVLWESCGARRNTAFAHSPMHGLGLQD